MPAIPSELLAQIANPAGPQNVLEMFARGSQQGRSNYEFNQQQGDRNALIKAANLGALGNYQGAAREAARTGNMQVMQGYTTMYDEQRKRAGLERVLYPGNMQGPPEAVVTGPVPNRGLPGLSTLDQPPPGGQFSQQVLAQARKAYAIGGPEAAQKVLLGGSPRPPTAEDKANYGADVLWMDAQGEPHYNTKQDITIENIPLKGQTKEEEVAGTKRGERLDALESGTTVKNLQQLRYIGQQMEGLNTGPLSGAQMTAGAFMTQLGASPETLKDFGIDPNLVTTGPQLQALINRQVIGMIGSGQFPAQNFSDTDRIFLEKIFPSLSNVPGANKLITATTERMMQIEEAKLQAWYTASDAGTTFRDFERQWNRELSKKDVFGDIAQAAKAMAPAATQQKIRIYNPKTGKLE